MSDDPKMRITPPAPAAGREILRKVVEAAAETIPGAGVLTAIYRTTFPSHSDRQRDDWQQAISERTNEHGERLNRHEALLLPPTYTYSGTAARLIEAIARACPDGLAEHFWDFEDVMQLVPDADPSEVEDAALELSAAGYLHERHLIGAHSFSPTQLLEVARFV